MKFNFTRIASSMLMAGLVTVCGAMNANGQTVLYSDDFDGSLDAAITAGDASRTFTPDLTDGLFPTAAGDVFGIVNIDAAFALLDESGGGFPADIQGIGTIERDGDLFLGITDTVNDDNEALNADGLVSAVWTFDITGASDLGLSFQMAAMGDFEGADAFSISASIDGGTPVVIASATPDEDIDFTYTLESGEPFTADDPFVLSGDGLSDTILFNSFESFSFPITGSGSELVITISAVTNGGGEAFGIDNLQITSGGGGGGGLTGDLNGDNAVDCLDLNEYAGNIGESATGTLADLNLNTDDVINLEDVQILIADLVVASNGITGTIVGDMNCDGQVNVLGDALILVNNLGNNDAVYTEGDVNFDGMVNVLGDALILVTNLGMNNQ